MKFALHDRKYLRKNSFLRSLNQNEEFLECCERKINGVKNVKVCSKGEYQKALPINAMP